MMQADQAVECGDPKDRIPKGSVIEGEVRIVSYLDPDTMHEMFAFAVSPSLPTSRSIGLVDNVKAIIQHDVLHEYLEEDEEDE
jgi:hypothetical protein